VLDGTPLAVGDSLTFATPSLDAPLLLMGNPTFNVTLSVDRPHAYVAVTLYDRAPDGTMSRVIPGYLNLAERDGRDTAKDVPTGTPLTVHVQLYATAHVFEAGHKLVLKLSGATEGIPAAPPDITTTTVKIAPDTPAVLWAPLYPLER
jgi:predicted acyl esterase